MKVHLKQISLFILCIFIFAGCFSIPRIQAAESVKVVDLELHLTNNQNISLTEKIDKVSEEIGVDIVIVTVTDFDDKSAEAYADDYMDYNGYSLDCVLLLVSKGEGEYYISTHGYAKKAFTGAAIENTERTIEPLLKQDDFYDAYIKFVDLSEDYVQRARGGDPFDSDDLPKEPFSILKNVVIALVIGFIIAIVVVLTFKSQLKTVHSKYTANDYEKDGSMKVTRSHDFFLYRTIVRVPRPKDNGSGGSHRSSSGRSHGGGGGRF